MSSRPQLDPFPVIGGTQANPVSGDMSASITSKVTIIQKLSMLSYEVVWSGATPVGLISVQASNDYSQNADGSVKNTGNWTDLPLSIAPAVSGNTGSGFIDIDSHAGYALRLVYTRASGTGTMTVTATGKVA